MTLRFFRIFFMLCAGLFLTVFASNAADPDISYELLSKSFSGICPSKESDFRPVFDKVRCQINPVLSEDEMKSLKRWLNAKQDLIRLIDLAIKKGSIQYPVLDVLTMEMPDFGNFRDALILKLLQAKQYLNDGLYGKATDAILDSIKYGKMIASGKRGCLIHYLVGTLYKSTGIKWLASVVCSTKNDRDTLHRILDVILQKNAADKALIAALTVELHSISIPFIEMISSQIAPILAELELDSPSIFDKQDSINIVRDYTEKVINNATGPWHQRDRNISTDFWNRFEEEFPDIEGLEDWILEFGFADKVDHFDINNKAHVAEWKKLGRLARNKKNLLGRTIFAASCLDFDAYIKQSIRLRTRNNLVRTFVAMQIFHDKYNRYPQTLHDLVAGGILERVPLDLFSSQPLHYSAGNHKIWSVGSDEKNDGGDLDKDIVFSCELTDCNKK